MHAAGVCGFLATAQSPLVQRQSSTAPLSQREGSAPGAELAPSNANLEALVAAAEGLEAEVSQGAAFSSARAHAARMQDDEWAPRGTSQVGQSTRSMGSPSLVVGGGWWLVVAGHPLFGAYARKC